MESTPDSGVEIRKAVVAPLFAPCFFNDAAAGSTPHDQSGRGTPKKAALATDEYRPLPKCRKMNSGFKVTLSKPAMIIPPNIYTDESSRMDHDSQIIIVKISIISKPLTINPREYAQALFVLFA